MNYSTVITVAVTVISVALAAAAFAAATRATRLKATSDNRAVDAAAYGRATDIYESTINALRAEVTRLSEEVRGVRAEILQVRADLTRLQATNDVLASELTQIRTRDHDDLSGFRERDKGRLAAYQERQDPREEDEGEPETLPAGDLEGEGVPAGQVERSAAFPGPHDRCSVFGEETDRFDLAAAVGGADDQCGAAYGGGCGVGGERDRDPVPAGGFEDRRGYLGGSLVMAE